MPDLHSFFFISRATIFRNPPTPSFVNTLNLSCKQPKFVWYNNYCRRFIIFPRTRNIPIWWLSRMCIHRVTRFYLVRPHSSSDQHCQPTRQRGLRREYYRIGQINATREKELIKCLHFCDIRGGPKPVNGKNGRKNPFRLSFHIFLLLLVFCGFSVYRSISICSPGHCICTCIPIYRKHDGLYTAWINIRTTYACIYCVCYLPIISASKISQSPRGFAQVKYCVCVRARSAFFYNKKIQQTENRLLWFRIDWCIRIMLEILFLRNLQQLIDTIPTYILINKARFLTRL